MDYNFDDIANENLKFYKLLQLNPNGLNDDFFIMLHEVKVKRKDTHHGEE
jgi:hypothetical protein